MYIDGLNREFDESCGPAQVDDKQIHCLLYEDYIVLVSTSQSGLQIAVDKLRSYCIKWNLNTVAVIYKKNPSIIFLCRSVRLMTFVVSLWSAYLISHGGC